MKLKSALAFALLTAWLPISLLLFSGCAWFSGKTPVDVAGTGEGIAVSTVNAAMTAWAQWVNAGNATQAQVDAVKAAYNQYYNAQLIASNAFTSYFASTSVGTNTTAAQTALMTVLATATSSQSNVVALIESFTKTNK